MLSNLILAAAFLMGSAHAAVDPVCQGLTKPADYNEQAQQDFLSNYVALATTFSPLHGPIPDEPGHGSLGLELSVIPPLGCERRLVLNYTKTEDTNKTPILPRPRLTFTFPALGPVRLYAGVAYVPQSRFSELGTSSHPGSLGLGCRSTHFNSGCGLQHVAEDDR